MGRTLTVKAMKMLDENDFHLQGTKYIQYDDKDTLEGKYNTYEEILTKIQEVCKMNIANTRKIVCIKILSTIANEALVPFEINFN